MSLDPDALVATHTRTVTRLYASADASRWAVSPAAFAAALASSAASRFHGADPPADHEVEAYLSSLHVADLALACACRAGSEPAWEHFIRECRPSLYAAARAISGEEGRDLADALYAELFGLSERDGERRSLLAYYHGRSRLTTWLRSILVQRHIDRRRATARLTSLDEDAGDGAATMADGPVDPDRAPYVLMAQAALDRAIAGLDDRDRLRLRLHYGHGLTLARIGRITGEHEATVSRKLERARRDLRRAVEAALRDDHGLTDEAIRECLDTAASAPEMHVSGLLAESPD